MGENKGTESFIQVKKDDWDNVNRAFRYFCEQLDMITGRRGSIALGSDLNLNDHKAINAADPENEQDVVNLEYADAHYGPEAIRAALSATGGFPLNVTQLPGVLQNQQAAIIVEATHASRITTNTADKYPVNSILYETDRMLFYRNVGGVGDSRTWTYLLGTWRTVHANRPGGKVTAATNASPIEITTDAAHNLITGDRAYIFGAFGNTAANGEWVVTLVSSTKFTLNSSTGNGAYAGSGQCCGFGRADIGLLLEETDRGPSTYRVDFISAAVRYILKANLSFPMQVLQANIPTDLNTKGDSSAFFRVDVTDYIHILKWVGLGWEFDDSDDGSKYFIDAPGVPTGGKWQECDGTTVNYLNADGTITSFTTPDEVSAPSGVYHKSIAAYTGTINAPTAPTLSGSTASSTTGASVNSNTTGAGISVGTTDVQSGSGATVVSSVSFSDPGHSHGLTDPGHTHGVGTLTVSTTGQPRNLGVRRFFRQ